MLVKKPYLVRANKDEPMLLSSVTPRWMCVIKLLINAYQKAVPIPNRHGEKRLCSFVYLGNEVNELIFHHLLERGPAVVRAISLQNDTVLHCACRRYIIQVMRVIDSLVDLLGMAECIQDLLRFEARQTMLRRDESFSRTNSFMPPFPRATIYLPQQQIHTPRQAR
jgi:hypothetical protein